MSDFRDFEEFWPFYVSEHAHPHNRLLHFVGTGSALGCIGAALLTKRRWLLAVAPLLGYGPAWIGHFLVEHNVPATFQHPLWSLRADFRMFTKIIAGTMDAEVERVMRERQGARDSDGAGDGANGHGRAAPPPSSDVDPSTLN